ncbi:hypothetical protein ABPG72_008580 [Tetrahymena utriculariae]
MVDQKQCLTNCPLNQYAEKGLFSVQYQCVIKCNDGQFISTQNNNNIITNYFVEACPFGQYVGVNNTCSPVIQCTNYLSMDGLTYLSQCPADQFPQLIATSKQLTCMPYLQKLSSDGKSCNKSCGSDELYNIQLRQCKPSSQCTGIKQNGLCLNQCQLGYLLTIENAVKACVSISSCTEYVSSDRQYALKNVDLMSVFYRQEMRHFVLPALLVQIQME